MRDSGKVTFCTLTNTATAGFMPAMRLVVSSEAFFEERAVGYNRFYAAQGVNEQIDLLIRVWRNTSVRIGMYAVLSMSENDGQYRITNVQHLLDEDGLKVTDVTLSRMDELYDITYQQTSSSSDSPNSSNQ